MDVTKSEQVDAVAADVVRRARPRSTSWSTTPALPIRDAGRRRHRRALAQRHRRESRTACSGAAAPSAGTCCEQGSGSIVNIGSMSGFIVNKPQAQSLLQRLKGRRASPHEIAGRRMGARGVRVNAVAPTYIKTPLTAFVEDKPDMYKAWIGRHADGRGWASSMRSPRLCCFSPPMPRA